MPVTIRLETLPQPPPPQAPPRKRWTRKECEFLEESGLFLGQSFELIEGELINKMGKRRRHVDSANVLTAWLYGVFGVKFVSYEAPIEVAVADAEINEPQPDLIVLKRSFTGFQRSTPRPEDLELIVEVSDTTLEFDLTTKASLYARAGIPEYWVLDVAGRCMIVHRQPSSGRYGSIAAYSESESVSPLAAPEAAFRVGDSFAL